MSTEGIIGLLMSIINPYIPGDDVETKVNNTYTIQYLMYKFVRFCNFFFYSFVTFIVFLLVRNYSSTSEYDLGVFNIFINLIVLVWIGKTIFRYAGNPCYSDADHYENNFILSRLSLF
mgnify:CR=1 FL=1